MIPFGRLHGWGKGLYIGLPAVALGAGGALWTASASTAERKKNAALSIAGVGLMAGSQWITIAVDRKLEAGLRKWNVPAPRLAIAALSAAVAYGNAVLDRRA